MSQPSIMIAELRLRLEELYRQTEQTPLFNPVFQLGLDLSRDIESGTVGLGEIGVLVDAFERESLRHRAKSLRNRLAPVQWPDNLKAFRELVARDDDTFEEFQQRWVQPIQHVVFTGHPTFLLTEAQSDSVCAALLSDGDQLAMATPGGEQPEISLADEHRQALAALANAQQARDAILAILFEVAAERWPDQWRALTPMPFRFATWIGYDMDGRTDLNWRTNIFFRLNEKALRLDGYAARAADAGLADMVGQLAAAARYSREVAAPFDGELTDPEALSSAANALTADHPDKLLSLEPVIDRLRQEAQGANAARATKMLVLAAAMEADGLGMGWVHFRMNASQLQNAVRTRLDPDGTLDLAGGTAMSVLRKEIRTVRPLRSNFVSLALENTTALRQFLTMAQILRHIDADTPIRLLIAECEEPQTVMAALYFAKLFGVEDKVDISPLFETETAMRHGGRFLDDLLAEDTYRDYARGRGRVSIQTGFSDAGRFVGQIPAALAIERLQGRLARAMEAEGLQDVAALIFNTHGESMGRGGMPGPMEGRLTWPMSHWSRTQFAGRGIATELEASFQGGDGFLYFRAPELALATLVRIAEADAAIAPSADDPFYERVDFSLDFYRSIRVQQRNLLEWRSYARSVSALGLSLLPQTGSRKSRRQSELAAERDMSLRQIRAIPHNAILQQLGYPVNVLAGAGNASNEDADHVASILGSSRRGREIAGLLHTANRLSSIKSLAAYGELFNSAFWASRPYRGTEKHLEQACLMLAERFTLDERANEFRRLASRLRVDGVKLHRLLSRLDLGEGDEGREDVRRSLGVLHALRLALIQHIFLRVVQVPPFARANDVSRDDVIEMAFALRTDEALAQLRRAYPVTTPEAADFSIDEPSDYPDRQRQPYSAIHENYLDPIEQSHQLIRRITVAVANFFGAFG